jgi:hypothetical protein
MKDVQEALDRLVPEPARRLEWEEVLRDARPRTRSLSLQLAVATGTAVLVALFVVAPWQGTERVGILDRALAAAGDEPVLHVVFRGGWGGTLVDLKTGERKPLYGEREVWYDPGRDLVHTVLRFGGVVEHESQYRRKPADRELKALWQQYRTALEDGTARVVGEDVVGGVPVYWVIVWRQMLPDVEDNKLHELAQQVAISRETFKPVAMKYTRDRKTDPRGTERILRYETVSVAEADFTSSPDSSLEGQSMSMGNKPIAIEQADEVLGRVPLWLGERFAGLPLVQTEKAFSATGQQQRTPITEERADEIRRCGGKCGKRFGGIASIDGKLYETGPVTFDPEHVGVTFFYGTLGDSPTTFKKDRVPLWTEPRVVITQTTDPELVTRGSTTKYEPPAGSLMLMPGPSGFLIRDGLRVTILASSEELILDAARSLRPMPNGGNGAGG